MLAVTCDSNLIIKTTNLFLNNTSRNKAVSYEILLPNSIADLFYLENEKKDNCLSYSSHSNVQGLS